MIGGCLDLNHELLDDLILLEIPARTAPPKGYFWKVVHDPTRNDVEPGLFFGSYFRLLDIYLPGSGRAQHLAGWHHLRAHPHRATADLFPGSSKIPEFPQRRHHPAHQTRFAGEGCLSSATQTGSKTQITRGKERVDGA